MAEDLRGTEILGFRIIELLGEGGMASVWKAEHTAIERTAAIKFLDPLLAKDDKTVERFRIEANVQNKLRHPNIVSVENFSLSPLAMVMEHVEGRTLAEIISHEVGPIPLQRALPYMRGILAAVEHAHDQGVVHRDLKPSNIMVTPSGEVMVMDFGIAKVLSGARLTRTGATLGTAVYMSPEQIRGKGVDARSDIYSLGVTFYEMLAGRPPFTEEANAESDFELKTAHVNDPPPDPRQFYKAIPEPVVFVVLRALAKDPSDRYQDAGGLREALEAGAKSDGDRQRRPSPKIEIETITAPDSDEKDETDEERPERPARHLLQGDDTRQRTGRPPRNGPKAPAATAQAQSAPTRSMSNSSRVMLALGLMMFIGIVWAQWGSGNNEANPPQKNPATKVSVGPVPGPVVKQDPIPEVSPDLGPDTEPVPGPDPRPKSPQRKAGAIEMKVMSDPSGAKILVNRRSTGKKTPAVLRFPTRREVAISLDMRGRKLVHWRGKPGSKPLYFNLARSIRVVKLTSTPSGAAVLLGNQRVGITPTNLRRPFRATKTYTFAFAKGGFKDEMRVVTGELPWARDPKNDDIEKMTIHVVLKKTVAPIKRATFQEFFRQGLRKLMQGDASAAVVLFNKSLEKNPRFAQAYRGMGLAYEKLGRKTMARAAFRRYLILSPRARDAEAIRKRIEMLR